ncbi:MAG: ABC transporter ATP-binding protein [Clostridia bacterium]|nr:ABC transporter ATP-binding protein [Clostridia bacterium]
MKKRVLSKFSDGWKKKAKLLVRHLRPAASAFAIGVGASFAATLLRTVFTQVIRFTVDGVILGETAGLPGWLAALEPGKMLAAACTLAAGVAILEFAVGFIHDSSLPKGSERFVKSLRDSLYSHIQRLPFSWHAKNPTGDIIQRCTSDVEVVRAFIADQVVEFVSTIFLIAVYMTMMFTMNVKISLLACAFVPLVIGTSIYYHGKIGKSFTAFDESEGALSSIVQENLTGVRVVRAFGRERDELKKFRDRNDKHTSLWLKMGSMMTSFWTFGDTVSFVQLFLVIILGVHMCVSGEITLGTYLAFINYTKQMNWPVRGLGRVITNMSKVGVSIDRLLYIIESEEEHAPENPKTADMRGDIRFDHVSFAYDEKPVLRDVSFTVPGGSTLGILGETGSGKSTVALLMARLYDPQAGAISIGGVDLRDMDQAVLRRGVGVVLQEPFLFSRTLKENVMIAAQGAADEQVDAAVKDACLYASIQEFKEGYDTVVGERGVTLSGGQKQRTAIARTLLSGAPVMVFDDSLSAVDAKTDAAIRERLRAAAGGSTLILIAHRVSTLVQADQIIVLRDGEIAERGTHEELLALGGIYARTAAMQSARGEAEADE